jgi:alpha-N-acetylglucosamine transferase
MVFLSTRSVYILGALAIVFIITTIHQLPSNLPWKASPSASANPNRHAFATLFAGAPNNTDANSIYTSDKYFIATRMLTYQLLHAPETRSHTCIPFLVLVTGSVPQDQRDRLALDGATVIPVETIHSDWVIPQTERWADVMAKLRLWQLTSYTKILFLDADSIITAPLDAVFDDPATAVLPTGTNPAALKPDESPLPPSYLFAGVGQLNYDHHFPPTLEGGDFQNGDYLNAGFFLIAPNPPLFEYYVSLLQLEGRFDPAQPEQNMLNYAHRRDGNMPWKQLDTRWNVMGPTWNDYQGGARSLHEKWWAVQEGQGEGELKRVFLSWRWRMEGFFESLDRARRGRNPRKPVYCTAESETQDSTSQSSVWEAG